MARIGTLAVIGAVTAIAGVRCIRVIPVVARIAIARDRNVRSCKRINGVVVKRRRYPRCLGVAGCAIRWKLLRGVVGHRRLRVIVCVTAVAGIWCVGIIAVVTGCAIVGNGCVSAIQRIKIIVDWEGCRRPAGGCGVAHRAICWQVERHVVGIYGLVEVGGMTSSALCRRTRIPCSVTFHTIGCQVFARQGETRRVVVKNNICISRGVAGQTSGAIVGIAVYTVVVIIRLRV